MIAFDVAEANQLLAAAETRLTWLAGITPSEERQLALEATVRAQFKLRAFLGIPVEITLRERAHHDHEEDERDPECICGTDAALARGETVFARVSIFCPKHDEDWSPRSEYFDGEYREPVVHRDDSQGYRDQLIDAGRGELLRG